jgi:hypothetical protein
MSDQFSLQGIHVHILKLLDELLLTPQVEIVKARLPELGQGMIQTLEAKLELPCGRAWFPAQPARHALLQNLHDRRRRALRRFADEQVDVLWHDNVSDQRKSIAVAYLAEYLHEYIF